MADAELSVVLRLIATQFQDELKKSGGALGQFNKLITDWRVIGTAVAGTLAAVTKQTADLGEELSKASQKTGIATDQLQGYLYAAKLADVSTEQFTQALTHLNKAIAENDQGLRSAGVRGTDITTVMGELNDLFLRLPDGPRKTALAMDLMGKSGASVIPVFNQNLQETVAEFERLGVKMGKDAIEASLRFNDNLKKLEVNAGALKVQLGNGLLPAASSFLDLLNKIVSKIQTIPGIPGVNPLIKMLAYGIHQGTLPPEVQGPPLPPGFVPPGPIVPSSGKEMLGPGNEKGVEAFYARQREQNELFIKGAISMEEDRQAKLQATLDLQLQNVDAAWEGWQREQTKLKETIDEYKKWESAADAANAKWNEQEARRIQEAEEAAVAWVKGKERLANLGFYDSLREGLQRYAQDNDQTFNLATDVVRQAASNMSQGFKTFFLDVLKGQVKDVRDLFAGLLNFTQNILADVAARLVSAGITTGLAGYFNTGPNMGAQLAAARGTANPQLYGPGFASGGSFVVGGSGGVDTTPVGFWATKGERVTVETEAQQRRGGVVVNVYNQTPAQVQTQSRTGAGGESIVDIVVRTVDQAMAGGSFDRSLATNFGVRRQGFAR